MTYFHSAIGAAGETMPSYTTGEFLLTTPNGATSASREEIPIPPEALGRGRDFANELVALMRKYGVELWGSDDGVVVADTATQQELFEEYGEEGKWEQARRYRYVRQR